MITSQSVLTVTSLPPFWPSVHLCFPLPFCPFCRTKLLQSFHTARQPKFRPNVLKMIIWPLIFHVQDLFFVCLFLCLIRWYIVASWLHYYQCWHLLQSCMIDYSLLPTVTLKYWPKLVFSQTAFRRFRTFLSMLPLQHVSTTGLKIFLFVSLKLL